jgi:hypothetical protein
MLTKTNLVNMINTNLTDDRLYSVQLYLDILASGRIGRVKDVATNTVLTDLASLSLAITPADIKVGYNHAGISSSNQMTPSILVTMSNIEIELLPNVKEDTVYTNRVGAGIRNLQFVMGYLSDGDTALPLKIIRVNLVNPISG